MLRMATKHVISIWLHTRCIRGYCNHTCRIVDKFLGLMPDQLKTGTKLVKVNFIDQKRYF